MSLRFYPLLLSFAMLVGLTACSTTGSAPVEDSSVGQDLSGKIGTVDSDSLLNIPQNPSTRNLAEIIKLSEGMSAYQAEVALEILRSLESVPSGQLANMIDGQSYDPEFTEWLELALQTRSLLINGSSISVAARKWADYHYGHVVTQANFPELMNRYGELFFAPSRVAILLPAEGGLAAAAKAIRDGILSAYLEHPGESVIRFYSSGQSSEAAVAAYLQAWQDGATQIIGPLRIESTRALASLDKLSVPILLLNEPASDRPIKTGQAINVNSLSLSQAEEAVAIANKALSQGHRQALVIVPDNAWGARIETAFATVFEQGEGHISATAHFDTEANDHSAMLTQLLKIDESRQRKADLQSRIGVPLTFEPDRRDDFDFIFMAANPLEGRELKPLLRFHDTGDIPVYAMGRIFSGQQKRASDQDLNGIVFPATPWQLQARHEVTLTLDSIRSGSFGNLYALGQDAWHLLPWLPLLQKDPDLSFPGDIGLLRLQANGHFHRQPAWAQFSAGRPKLYQWPPH